MGAVTRTENGALVVELLTRAVRAGFAFRYSTLTGEVAITHDHTLRACDLEPELQRITTELRRYRPDVLAVLNRTCTVRTCTSTTWLREHGTDLAWCRPHGGTRGLQLVREERPDLFPTEET